MAAQLPNAEREKAKKRKASKPAASSGAEGKKKKDKTGQCGSSSYPHALQGLVFREIAH